MSSSDPIHILHVTDPHLHADPGTELYGVQTDHSFCAVIERAFSDDRWRPDAVLATGDLAEDRSRQAYERFREIMAPWALPVLTLPGNHDDPDLMSRVLNGGDFSYCSSCNIGGWRIIMLNSYLPGDEGGLLQQTEIERLDADLAAAKQQHALVCVHHQPIDMGSTWIDGYGLRNASDMLSILRRHAQVRGVLWGHVHQASDRECDGLRMLSTPSTCAQFTPGTEKCVMDVRPPGFRRLTLKADGTIATEVMWLDDWKVAGRPPDSRREK